MVLRHGRVFCCGGPEQRAVHKGCRMGRRDGWAGGGTGERTSVEKRRKKKKQLQAKLRFVVCASVKNINIICF